MKLDPDSTISYDAAFSRFVVSILWRTLVFRRDLFLQAHPDFARQTEEVEQDWRNFLLGSAAKPGSGSCHAMILGEKIVFGSLDEGALPSRGEPFQRYLALTIELDIVGDVYGVYVYAKLGRLLAFGFIESESENKYRASRVGLRNGFLGPRTYLIPPAIMAALFRTSERTFAAVDSLSPTQKAKIDQKIDRALKARKRKP